MLDQVLEGQQKMNVQFNKKLDFVYIEMNRKFKAQYSHLKKLDVKVTQTAKAVKRQERMLLERSKMNPRQFVNVIPVEGDEHHEPERPNKLHEAGYGVTEVSVDRHHLGVG